MTETNGSEGVSNIGNNTMNKFDGVWFNDIFVKDREELNSMVEANFGDDDILVATYPKCGTAWLQRILALIKNDADIAKTDQKTLDQNSLFLEMEKVPAVLADEEPRIIKSHFQYRHIPRSFREGKGKIVYMLRNPKDVAVSFYFFHKMLPFVKLKSSFGELLENFLKGHVPFGSYSEHIKSFWEHRNDANVLWLTYEDMHLDLKSNIAKIAKFWGKQLTEEQISIIADASSYSSMKKNPATNYQSHGLIGSKDTGQYMRKGKVGDWRNHFTPEQSQAVDAMVEREILPLGVQLCYD